MSRKVLVINPNTSPEMTAEIAATAEEAFGPGWTVITTNPTAGPASIESWFEETLAATAMLGLVQDYPDVDGVVVACFGDPGLFALREIVAVPVVALAEAAFVTAMQVGWRFGTLVGPVKDQRLIENLLWTYGLERRSAGVATLDLPVLDLHRDPAATLARLVDVGETLAARGAESLILGCAGLTAFRPGLEAATGLPVIDPVAAACHQLALLVTMGLRTARRGLFAPPDPKRLDNLAGLLSPAAAERLTALAARGFRRADDAG